MAELSLFEKLYEAGEAALKAINKPLIARKLRRALESAYDDASKRIDDAEARLFDIRKDLAHYDINAVLTARKQVADAKMLQAEIKAEYKELFGTELSVRD